MLGILLDFIIVLWGFAYLVSGLKAIYRRNYSYSRTEYIMPASFKTKNRNRDGKSTVVFGLSLSLSGTIIMIVGFSGILEQKNQFIRDVFLAAFLAIPVRVLGYAIGEYVYQNSIKNKEY